MSPLGNEYRLVIYASDVEKASSSQRVLTVKPDNRLDYLVAAYDQPFTPGAGGGGSISDAAISRGLVVESGEGAGKGKAVSPVATAKFSYTILAR
jgi:hypothetical protein